MSSIVVPGAGEANIDSFEDGVFENTKARREREVRGLLDKVCPNLILQTNLYLYEFLMQLQPDMITLDPEFIGQLAEPGHVPFTTAELPFSKKPRLDRLRELGRADESPASDDEGEEGGNEEERSARREEKTKMKMRGKGKSMKRYLKKKRKNVIDPSSVSIFVVVHRWELPLTSTPCRSPYEKRSPRCKQRAKPRHARPPDSRRKSLG